MKLRYVTQLFQPVITLPKNAIVKNSEITCKSQKLLLECGLVRHSSPGLFTLMPLARRALDKLERLVQDCVETAGGQRVTLPALTSAALWERSGRLGGQEIMTMKDRHNKTYVLSPTHEEAIADLLADVGPLSYKQLPLILYQITNKYRDEYRPKHGLLRARSFAMLDAYSAHSSEQCARGTYARLCDAYKQLFYQLQLKVHRVQAPTGDMGGTLSHEWQLPAEAGEDVLAVCTSCSHAALAHGGDECTQCGKRSDRVNSIEVGHTFILGTKYSDPLRALYTPSTGPTLPIVMCCFGIGITRLLAASLEALSSEKSLRWPSLIAPYSVIVIGPKEGSKEWSSHGWDKIIEVGTVLSKSGLQDDVLIDDRHNLTIGKRLMMAEKMGYTYIVVCGKSTQDDPPKYEVYRCTTDRQLEPQLMTLQEMRWVGLADTAGADKNKHLEYLLSFYLRLAFACDFVRVDK